MLYLPIGPPGAGKSYLANLMVESGTLDPDAIVCPDNYRRILTGDASRQFENATAFSICRQIASARLRNGLDVWIDATNLRADWFAEHVDMANKTRTSITTILFDTPLEECERRNNERPTPVPRDIMDSMFEHYRCLDRSAVPGAVVYSSDVLSAIAQRDKHFAELRK